MSQNASRIGELSSTIEELNGEIEADADLEMDTSEYENDIQAAEELLQQLDGEESHLRASLEEREPEIEKLKDRVNDVSARNEKVLADMRAAEVSLWR